MTELVVNGVKIDSETVFQYAPNPKRAGFNAHARYAEYEAAETLSDYLELADPKFAKADLRYDVEHGHLELDPIIDDDAEEERHMDVDDLTEDEAEEELTEE